VSQFLSEEWLEQAKAIREEYKGQGGAPPHQMRMNLVITDVPAEVSEAPIDAHLDTTQGDMEMDMGHLDGPDLTVTLEYDTAKAILIEGNPQAGMQAFMAGKIKVQGDMTKLMAMQSGAPDATAQEVAGKIKAITA
jgi:putative sterol carrier protein